MWLGAKQWTLLTLNFLTDRMLRIRVHDSQCYYRIARKALGTMSSTKWVLSRFYFNHIIFTSFLYGKYLTIDFVKKKNVYIAYWIHALKKQKKYSVSKGEKFWQIFKWTDFLPFSYVEFLYVCLANVLNSYLILTANVLTNLIGQKYIRLEVASEDVLSDFSVL